MLPSLTLNYGLRYEFFAPYTEKYGRLAEVLTNPAEGFTSQTAGAIGTSGAACFAGVPVHQGICAACGNCVETAEAKADGGSRRVRDELHGWFLCDVCDNDGSSTAVCKPADEPGDYIDGRANLSLRANRHVPDACTGISRPGDSGKLRARSALPFAVRADVESRYPEDAAVGRGDERRLQRIEGKSSGYRHGSARARGAALTPIHRICSFVMNKE